MESQGLELKVGVSVAFWDQGQAGVLYLCVGTLASALPWARAGLLVALACGDGQLCEEMECSGRAG